LVKVDKAWQLELLNCLDTIDFLEKQSVLEWFSASNRQRHVLRHHDLQSRLTDQILKTCLVRLVWFHLDGRDLAVDQKCKRKPPLVIMESVGCCYRDCV